MFGTEKLVEAMKDEILKEMDRRAVKVRKPCRRTVRKPLRAGVQMKKGSREWRRAMSMFGVRLPLPLALKIRDLAEANDEALADIFCRALSRELGL